MKLDKLCLFAVNESYLTKKEHDSDAVYSYLKKIVLSHVSKKAWKFLSDQGDDLFNDLWSIYTGDKKFSLAISYLKFIQNIDCYVLTHPILKICMNYIIDDNTDFSIDDIIEEIDPRIMRYVVHNYNSHNYYDVDDVYLILNWAHEYKPIYEKHFNYNFILNQSKKWERRKRVKAESSNIVWFVYQKHYFFSDFIVLAISNSLELFEASNTLRNCAYRSKFDAHYGFSRVFLIYKRSKKKPIAMMEIVTKNNNLFLDQVKGFANREPEKSVINLANNLYALYCKKFNNCTIREIRQ